jgi:hypothetical protein
VPRTIDNYRVVVAQSLATSFNSAATNVQHMSRICYDVSWTGDAVGSIIVQGSSNQSNWTNLNMTAITMAGVTDNGLFDIQVTGVPYLRLAYTSTSGTGTINAYVSAKES